MILTTWQKEHILDERGEHVPWLQVDERRDKVKTVSRRDRDDELLQGLVLLNQPTGQTQLD